MTGPSTLTQLELLLDDRIPTLTEYTVNVSKRARYVSFQVLPIEGLMVTVPLRFPQREIPRLLLENKQWIEEQIQRVRDNTDPEFLQWPPQRLCLNAVGRIITIHYEPAQLDVGIRVSLCGDVMKVQGRVSDTRTLVKQFATVLKREARKHFEPKLHQFAQQHALNFKRLSIRGQRTLWGSYSTSGTLSLNYKLLFLPAEYCDYVLLHELAHIRHLDHSPAFWQFLQTLCPDARRLDRELDAVSRFVPPWL